MSFTRLPDGSEIGPRSKAPDGAILRDSSDTVGITADLRELAKTAWGGKALRKLVGGGGLFNRKTDDQVVKDAVAQLKSGKLVLLEAGGDESTVQPKVQKTPPPPVQEEEPAKKGGGSGDGSGSKGGKGEKSDKKDETKVVSIVPTLAAEFLVVLRDRDLAKHQADTDPKYPTGTTRLFLSLRADQSSPKFTGSAKLKISGSGAVDVYSDAELKKKLDLAEAIPAATLLGSKPYPVYLKGKTAGLFEAKLEIDAPPDGFKASPPSVAKMGVVDLAFQLFEHDEAALKALQVDPDTDPVSQYGEDLKAKDLPAQKEMTDERKVKIGRLLHVQKDNHFSRAKVVVKKLVAAQWPDGTDAYTVTIQASDAADPKKPSAAIGLFDKEWEGTAKSLTHSIKVSALKAAEAVLWFEGKVASKKPLDVRLDLGLDRAVAAPEKEAKRNADWARFTIAQIKELKLDYKAEAKKPVAWDEKLSRFYINYKADPEGRKLKFKATLSEKLKDVVVHFMLAPDENNLKTANWGVDLPTTWKWKDIGAAVKHLDKKDRKDVLHLSAKTDANGVASAELKLSRFGGDRFHPGAYLSIDPHLAKYLTTHADLKKKKPVMAEKSITVWRQFWYQVVKVEGMNPPALAGAVSQYDEVKATMTEAKKLDVTRKTVKGYTPQAIYPRYMIEVNGGNADALVVSDSNKAQFFADYKPEDEKPIKTPILICDAQWDIGTNSAPANPPGAKVADFPLEIVTDKLALSPPLQGGDLLVSATWKAGDWVPPAGAVAGHWTNVRSGTLAAADISIDPARTNRKAVSARVPAGLGATTAQTKIWIENLIIQGAKGPYLGEYSSATKRILAVYKPTDPVDFQNTISHELGHSFRQVVNGTKPAGAPDHPHQYIHQGSHCRYDTNKCVMYQSGPITGSLNKYCPVCHPYVLANDFQVLS